MISFDDVEQLINQYASPGIRPGLDRIGRLLFLLGDPQGAYPAVHVVGTNGKGSTCAFLASAFTAAGYRTVLYTSPHLESPGERLVIDGEPLSPDRWMAAAEKIVRILKDDSILRQDAPSYFELVTAAAFVLMAEEKVEAAVVEAGLGGRLDATNLLSNVACSAICSISMDHTDYLGDTLEKIAGEKFAVVRAGTPACYLGDAPELLSVFARFCGDAGAVPFTVSGDVRIDSARVTDTGCAFDFAAPGFELKEVRTGLVGRYQVSNAALALLVLSRLRERFERLTEPAIRRGFQGARWPGRLEIVHRSPMIVLDGGHNFDGVTKLAESAMELWGDKKIGIVYGVMKDKDYESCIGVLNGLKPSFYAACVPGMGRSLPPDVLADRARRLEWRNAVRDFGDPLEAVDVSVRENDVTIVCGSLYLIGYVRPRILKKWGNAL